MVSDAVTIADISIFATLFALAEIGKYEYANLLSVHRWFMTMGNIPRIKSVFGDVTAYFKNAPSASAVPSSATAPSALATVPSTLQRPGKWDRRRIRIKELLQQGVSAVDSRVTVKGWVRTIRSAEKGKLLFVELTDGSTIKGVQLVLSSEKTTGFKAVEDCGGAGQFIAITLNSNELFASLSSSYPLPLLAIVISNNAINIFLCLSYFILVIRSVAVCDW